MVKSPGKNKVIIVSIFLSFFILSSAFALEKIGAECEEDSQCETAECEDSENGPAYCVCSEVDFSVGPLGGSSDNCAQMYSGIDSDPENWICTDGADATWDLNYCAYKKDSKQNQYPIPPGEVSTLDKILDSGAAYDIIYGKEFEGAPINLAINIPGLEFSEIREVENEEGTFIYIPQIGEYIAAVYRYSVIVASILAIVIIISSGLQWTISGGSPEKIKNAQKRIAQAIMGLVIAILSYALLSTINPELINFRALRVLTIASKSLDDIVFDTGELGGIVPSGDKKCPGKTYTLIEHCGVGTDNTKIPHSDFDELFKNFSACGNFDWRILKGIALHESSYRPYLTNCACYRGLFQFKKASMDSAMGKNFERYTKALGISSAPLTEIDPRIFNFKMQTLSITLSINRAIKQIHNACGKEKIDKMNDSDKATLLYTYHNSGSGTLGKALKAGACDGGNSIDKAVIIGWTQIFEGRYKKSGKVYGVQYNSFTEAHDAGVKFGTSKSKSVRKAGENTIKLWKAEDLFTTKGGTCPVGKL